MPFRRNLARVAAARFIARAGSEGAFFVGVWGTAAFTFGATPSELALIMLSLSVSLVSGSALGGVLVDRYGPRRVLILAHAAFVPAALSITLADSVSELAMFVAFWGFTGAPILTAGASFAPFLTSDAAQLKLANARIEAAGAAAFIVGPAAGALIARYASIDLIFVFDAVTSLLAALIVWSVRLEPHVRATRSESPLAELTMGTRVAYARSDLRFYILVGAVVWVGFGVFGVLEPLFFRDFVRADVEILGWVNSVMGIGFVIGAFVFERLPAATVSLRGLALAVCAIGMATVAYVLTPSLPLIFAGALLLGAAAGLFAPLQRTLIHRDSPHECLGRVIGATEVHNRAAELLPLAFAPLLAYAFGVHLALIGGGAAIALVALAVLPYAIKTDRVKPAVPVAPDYARVGTDEPLSPNP